MNVWINWKWPHIGIYVFFFSFFSFIADVTWTHNLKIATVGTFHCATGLCKLDDSLFPLLLKFLPKTWGLTNNWVNISYLFDVSANPTSSPGKPSSYMHRLIWGSNLWNREGRKKNKRNLFSSPLQPCPEHQRKILCFFFLFLSYSFLGRKLLSYSLSLKSNFFSLSFLVDHVHA